MVSESILDQGMQLDAKLRLLTVTDTQRGVLQTQTGEAKSGNGTGISHAEITFPSNTGGEVDFLQESQLAHKLGGLLVSFLPASTSSLCPRRRVAGWGDGVVELGIDQSGQTEGQDGREGGELHPNHCGEVAICSEAN